MTTTVRLTVGRAILFWEGMPLMTTLRLAAMLAALALLLPAVSPAQTQACRSFLMRHDDLRQLYARGDGMAVRVAPVPNRFSGLTAARVHELAVRKLRSSDLYDADAAQWLDINVNVGVEQYAILMSLRRWADDLGYGLPGESTVWGVGGGGRHLESPGRVMTRVAQHLDEFISLYVRAQRACTM